MNDGHQHYFTAEPRSSQEERQVTVRLGGRDVVVRTAAGVFSPGRVDLGTSVLLREAPPPPAAGNLLDLGCGWGPLALTLGLASPRATVWAVDTNRRALHLCAANAAVLGIERLHCREPAAVPSDLEFDLIWSNPPIRVGKDALHDLLRRWLPRLAPGATAYLVVQRNLGSDSLQAWLEAELPHLRVRRHGSAKGYRVLAATRPP